MNLVQRIKAEDAYLVPYLLGWAGHAPPQSWGAAASFALEIAHGYGLIKGESDPTLTPVGVEVARHLSCDSDRSGEAGETGTGSTVGESAGPQGHRPDFPTSLPKGAS